MTPAPLHEPVPLPRRPIAPPPANDPDPPFPAAPARRAASLRAYIVRWILRELAALVAVAGFCALIILAASS